MKTFNIYDAISFLLENGYNINDIIAIGFSNQAVNKYEFTALSVRDNQITINLDENTIKVEPWKDLNQH